MAIGLLASFIISYYFYDQSLQDTNKKLGRVAEVSSEAIAIASKIYDLIDKTGVVDSLVNKYGKVDSTKLYNTISSMAYQSPEVAALISQFNSALIYKQNKLNTEQTKYENSVADIKAEIANIDNKLSAIANKSSFYTSGTGLEAESQDRINALKLLSAQAESLAKERDVLVGKLNKIGTNFQQVAADIVKPTNNIMPTPNYTVAKRPSSATQSSNSTTSNVQGGNK